MLRFPFSCPAAICHDERLRIYSQLRLWINPFSLQSAVQLAMKHEVQYLAMKLAAQSVWRELTERNRSQIWHYHTKILYINPQICPHLVHRLLSFSWVTRRRFSTSLIPLQRLSGLTAPPNSTANKYRGAEKEGGLLTFHQGASYPTE